MAGIGAFTTDELLAWLSGVKPTARQKKNVVNPPPPGTLAYHKQLQAEEEARAKREKEARRLREEREEEDGQEEEDDEDEGVALNGSNRPHYNLKPDDEEAFNFEGDYYDPGNPTNPKAQPGDHDYAVDQSTDVFLDFSFDKDENPTLPIHQFRQEILSNIESGQVLLVVGGVACWWARLLSGCGLLSLPFI